MVVATPSLAVGESPKAEPARKDNFQESIGKMPPEEKLGLFVALLKELRRVNGSDCAIPLTTTDGEDLGCIVPPTVFIEDKQQPGPKLTDEQRAEFDRRRKCLHEAIPIEQFFGELKQKAVELQHRGL